MLLFEPGGINAMFFFVVVVPYFDKNVANDFFLGGGESLTSSFDGFTYVPK